ncbi:MAG: hypothetical protein EA397_04525 [Deltaproteobacteria bacterium]|nr:MAG: hypothetical protein EA397_04525 [Deltaproteobacteria bacterium]
MTRSLITVTTCLVLASGCFERSAGEREAARLCQAYARSFAEGAALRCQRGDFESNLRAFRAAAGVGQSCERVHRVRDPHELEEYCLPWVSGQADCPLFDDPRAYIQELPDACRGQLLLQGDG